MNPTVEKYGSEVDSVVDLMKRANFGCHSTPASTITTISSVTFHSNSSMALMVGQQVFELLLASISAI